MLKCKDNNMALLYAMLISRIFIVFSINLSRERCEHLGWTNYFGKKNIAQTKYLSCKWYGQYGTADDDNDEDGEEPPQVGDHVQQPTPEGLVPLIPHHG